MNKPVYEIPVTGADEPVLPPTYAPGTTANAAPATSYLNAPPPTFPPPAAEAWTPTAPAATLPPPLVPEQTLPPMETRRSRAAAAQPAEFEAPLVIPLVPADGDDSAGDRDLIAALVEVVRIGASDLHVSVGSPPMVRVDGGLRHAGQVWNAEKVSSALRSILTDAQRARFDEELEFDFAFTIPSGDRFRVNFYQQRTNMGGAFRLIPTEIKPLDKLGVPDSVKQFAELPRGLVLVTGPTGSGKSTTLAALIDLVNRTRADHVMTVEDPIEFIHPNHKSLVNQREVGSDTHSFGAALKHVLRQDPDVILIGELRDLETISVALTAAETGHLVFATLHTQDAPQTVDRIIDVFPPHAQGQVRTQLAATLQGVVCQTLVKKASGSGRVVATEILVATPAIANLIREGKTYQIPSAMQAGRSLGMQTMDQHLADLVNAGEITHEAAMDKVHDFEGFKQLVHRAAPTSGQSNEFATDFGRV